MKQQGLLLFLSLLNSLIGGPYEEKFERIYQEKIWGSSEEDDGFSGGGSLLQYAFLFHEYLTRFLQDHQIRSVVDLGCGDWTFAKWINWRGIDYIGYDVVGSVIEKKQCKIRL